MFERAFRVSFDLRCSYMMKALWRIVGSRDHCLMTRGCMVKSNLGMFGYPEQLVDLYHHLLFFIYLGSSQIAESRGMLCQIRNSNEVVALEEGI
jgi:hypothetical protein